MTYSDQEQIKQAHTFIRRCLLMTHLTTEKKRESIAEEYALVQEKASSVYDIETYIDIMYRYYSERKALLPEEEKAYLYEFCLNAYCKTAQQGGIQSKWVLGNELMKPTYLLKTDSILGNFLITLAGHEGHSGACDYLANRYCLYNFDEGITDHWLKKSQEVKWWDKKSEPINLTLIEEGNIMYITIVN